MNSAITHRAFSRNDCESSIMFTNDNTEEYHKAKICNSSSGGMYFESDHSVRPGSTIFIKMETFGKDVIPDDITNKFFAEVRWCIRKGNSKTPYYGVGVRFINDLCRQCGQKINYDLDFKPNCVDLCRNCHINLDRMGEGEFKNCFENYLMGNVL